MVTLVVNMGTHNRFAWKLADWKVFAVCWCAKFQRFHLMCSVVGGNRDAFLFAFKSAHRNMHTVPGTNAIAENA